MISFQDLRVFAGVLRIFAGVLWVILGVANQQHAQLYGTLARKGWNVHFQAGISLMMRQNDLTSIHTLL